MNPVELNKEFIKFREITDQIIKTEFCLNTFSFKSDNTLTALEKLKFKCLKFELCDLDELENFSNFDEPAALKFCDELKQNINQEFINNIRN